MVVTTRRVFTMEDQHAFADFSGDYNPMHVDPIAARRLQAGAPVVHGIHLLLWALDVLATHADAPLAIGTLRADFNSFLTVGREVGWSVAASGEQTRIALLADAIPIMSVELRRDPRQSAAQSVSYPAGPSHAPGRTPLDPSFSRMQGMGGETPFFRPAADHPAMFPKLAGWIGAERIAALACSTRIVGMVCPGLHSIFNRIEASITETDDRAGLRFAVVQADERFSRIRLAAHGAGVAAVLTTTVRPRPVEQPAIGDIASFVERRAFEGADVLVVGGSRGLGELTAKYVAAGGARVAVTYASGRADAERVAAEIERFGGPCRALAFDARRPAAPQLEEQASRFTHVYYFATPRIVSSNARSFDAALFDRFFAYYVTSFVDLCGWLNGAKRDGRVRVLYPSSAWVRKDERPPGWTEYAMAKAAGEVICDDLGSSLKNVAVTTVRLPRLPTDQTASVARDDGVSSVEVMGRIIDAFQL